MKQAFIYALIAVAIYFLAKKFSLTADLYSKAIYKVGSLTGKTKFEPVGGVK